MKSAWVLIFFKNAARCPRKNYDFNERVKFLSLPHKYVCVVRMDVYTVNTLKFRK